MCYCINPSCPQREIIDTAFECPFCHTTLLINNRYLLVKPLRSLDIPHPYAEIFEVKDLEESETSKVLKVLKNNSTRLVELFNQEASILSHLMRHSGIPRAENQFSMSLSNGQDLHCLVMERIEGQNLEQWLEQNQQVSQEQALHWLQQLVEILDYVHQNEFFHRDIKPSNIMRKPDGQLVLIDFGTAREVSETVINGQNVTVVFSDGYTAPEQIQGQAVPQSDFFALGRTFVHLLTGRRPNRFSIDSQTKQLTWRDSAPQVSSSLADFIDELMAPSVEQRPQNTQVILQRVHELNGNTFSRHLTPSPSPRLGWWGVGLTIGLAIGGLLVSILNVRPNSPVADNFSAIASCKSPVADDVSAIDFSPDGKYIATVSLDKTIRVLDGTDPKKLVTCQQHTEGVVAVKFSPDGKYLATASLDATAGLGVMSKDGSISNFKLLHHNRPVVAIDFSRDGKFLATASTDGSVQIWNAKNYQTVAFLKDKAYVRAVSFSPSGRYLAAVSLDNEVRVWDWNNHKFDQKFILLPQKNVVAIAFSPKNGKYLAAASADGTVQVWDTTNSKEIARLKHQTYVMAIKFSPDGRYLATVSLENKAKVWKWEVDRKGQKPLSLPQDNVVAVAFSPSDGKYLATASNDGTGQVWETANGKNLTKVPHRNSVVDIAFSPVDHKYLVTAGADGTVKLTKWEP
jgi:WD40 repeat protein